MAGGQIEALRQLLKGGRQLLLLPAESLLPALHGAQAGERVGVSGRLLGKRMLHRIDASGESGRRRGRRHRLGRGIGGGFDLPQPLGLSLLLALDQRLPLGNGG